MDSTPELLNMPAGKRWTAVELDLLESVREALKEKFLRSAPYPEVVGDRKLIRFIRGHNNNLPKIVEMVEKFLDWRFENGVDDIRKDIVENKLTPNRFPGGDVVFKNVDIMVITPPNPDDESFMELRPISGEPFMSPAVFAELDVEVYVRFRIYCMEYIAMVLEQISDMKEKRILAALKEGEDKPEAYGYIEKLKVVRDLSAFSMFSFGGANQALGRRIMLMSADNYPEILNKCYVCNAPWVFNTIFSAMKLILPAQTISKVDMLGRNYLSVLDEEIGLNRLAEFLGGTVPESNPPYLLDTSDEGPLALVDIGSLLVSSGDPRLEQHEEISWGKAENATESS